MCHVLLGNVRREYTDGNKYFYNMYIGMSLSLSVESSTYLILCLDLDLDMSILSHFHFFFFFFILFDCLTVFIEIFPKGINIQCTIMNITMI